MDDVTQRLHDAMVEDELARGYRVKAVPDEVRQVLALAQEEDPELAAFDHVRFTKLTMRQKALAADHVMRRFNADMQDDQYLSTDQLRNLSIKRGSWSPEKDDRITELSERSTEEMRDLYLAGFDRRDNWIEQFNQLCETYTEALTASDKSDDEKEQTKRVFFRWLNADISQSEEYKLFAIEQGLPEYSAGRDFMTLLETAIDPEMQDVLSDLDSLKHKIKQLQVVTEMRQELNTLIEARGKMLANSIEARRDRVEQMAQMYYGIQRADADGKPRGPLTPSFEKFWDLPDKVIEWLQVESYFFYEGIPEASRGFLEQWGFIPAESANGSQPVSEESPAPQNAKNDTPPVTATDAASLEPATATN